MDCLFSGLKVMLQNCLRQIESMSYLQCIALTDGPINPILILAAEAKKRCQKMIAEKEVNKLQFGEHVKENELIFNLEDNFACI